MRNLSQKSYGACSLYENRLFLLFYYDLYAFFFFFCNKKIAIFAPTNCVDI